MGFRALFQRVRGAWHSSPTPDPYLRWESWYGPFTRPDDITATAITGLDKESGAIHRFIVAFVDDSRSKGPISPLLLAGEYIRVVPAYEEWLGLNRDEIVTTGLGEVDVVWDYELEPPSTLGSYKLILSQSMFEHLLDPYRHICDLYGLLEPGGTLIIQTHTPGFHYHRYPIDTLRFFPDWFETVALRLGATVTGKLVGDDRILYRLQKPHASDSGQ